MYNLFDRNDAFSQQQDIRFVALIQASSVDTFFFAEILRILEVGVDALQGGGAALLLMCGTSFSHGVGWRPPLQSSVPTTDPLRYHNGHYQTGKNFHFPI